MSNSNNRRKKLAAKQFNELRAERLAAEKDRIENPEKYKTKTRTKTRSKNTMAILTALTAMSVVSHQ